MGSAFNPGMPVSSEIQETNSCEFNSSVTAPSAGGKSCRLAMPSLFSLACLYCVQASVEDCGDCIAISMATPGRRKYLNKICGQGWFSRYCRASPESRAPHLSYGNGR